MKEVEWTEPAIEDMAALDKSIARRAKQAVERFAESGAGNVKTLQGIDPPQYRLRVVELNRWCGIPNWGRRVFNAESRRLRGERGERSPKSTPECAEEAEVPCAVAARDAWSAEAL